MPKAKPDKVIVHRIELQETERATLEAALAGRFVTNSAMAAGNLLKGVGAALAPFSGALTALAALWIAEKSVEEIAEIIGNTKENIELLYDSAVQANGTYSETVAWLNVNYANSGFDRIPDSPSGSKLTQLQKDSWSEHRENCLKNWGPFDAGFLIKVVAKAVKDNMGDGMYIDQRTGTPGEWFTKELSLEQWQAWQTQYNARRNAGVLS